MTKGNSTLNNLVRHSGQQQRYSTLVCSETASERSPRFIESIERPLYSSTPGVLGSPSFLLPPGIQWRAVPEMLPALFLSQLNQTRLII